MRKNLLLGKATFLWLFLSFTGTVKAQNNSDFPHQTANGASIDLFMNEVYANCPEYINESQKLRELQKISRIEIYQVPLGMYPECPLLSEVLGKNKCNPNLDFSIEDFDPATFNPIKYFLKYSDTESFYYRVDGQNYIIEVKPKS